MTKTYWVMYCESTRDGKPFHSGTDQSTRTRQHCGLNESDFDDAKASVLHFRDLASQGKHFLNERQWPNLVINSAWLEVERRERLEF